MAKERVISLASLLVAFTVAVVLLWSSGVSGWWVTAVGVVGVAFLAVHARRGRHTSWEAARRQLGPDHAVVFWKPGCMFCEQLLRAVGKDERVTWVNVWVDEQANAEVRRLNDGNELTPTALVGDRVLRNPSAHELLASLVS